MTLVCALISDEFQQTLKNRLFARQIGLLSSSSTCSDIPKAVHYCRSEAIEYNLMSGLFIWFLTSFSSSFPLFWWILYEPFWVNKSHQSFDLDSLPSTPVKLDQTQRLVWFSEISAVWKHQFSLCYLTGKPSWFIRLIPSTTLCSTSQ